MNNEPILNNPVAKYLIENWPNGNKTDKVWQEIESLKQVEEAIKELKEKYPHYTQFITQLDDLRLNFKGQLKVGDGVTLCFYTDCKAGTITEISKSGKAITFKVDNAKLSPDFKPEVVLGGFVGHCTNQDKQTYTYTPDEHGIQYTAKLSTNGRWYVGGKKGLRVLVGVRNTFYDYNF